MIIFDINVNFEEKMLWETQFLISEWPLCTRINIHIFYNFFEKAAADGQKDVVEFLASKGADIHHENNDGMTALMSGIFNFDKNTLILFHFII